MPISAQPANTFIEDSPSFLLVLHPMRILMVCLGNICRSPIAEGVLRSKIKEHGLNWTVASAGTNSYHTGEAPHRFSQKICLAHGLDISHLRASLFSAEDLRNYDKIYAFADDVYSDIKRICGRGADLSNVDYFLNELRRRPIAGMVIPRNAAVPDPYYGDEAGYGPVYDLIEQACEAIIQNYTKENYV
jgi:protein-tyrosine phosphatase